MDYDEVKKYNPGNILPIFIFFIDDVEKERVVGEKKESEMLEIVKKYS